MATMFEDRWPRLLRSLSRVHGTRSSDAGWTDARRSGDPDRSEPRSEVSVGGGARPTRIDAGFQHYFVLHMAGFLATTLLITWGLFVLFFLAIGGLSLDGMMHQLNNMASRYVAADAGRIASFKHVLFVAHTLLSAAVIFFRRRSILPARDPRRSTSNG